MWSYLGESKPKARKRHQCYICSGSIWPGTIYRKSSFTGEGTAYTIKEHLECARVAAKWCDAWDYPDGYQGEDVLEAMEEGLHDFFLSRNSDFNVYAVGDLDRDERKVWSRFRQSQARFEISQAMKNDRHLKQATTTS